MLKHSGRIKAYIKAYTRIMLETKDMSDEDHLYHFMKGLQNWAQAELWHQGVKTLTKSVAAADKLLDFRGDKEDEVNGNKDGNKKRPMQV